MPVDPSTDVPTLSVIVPAYNEEATLARVIGEVLDAVPHSLEIIVVDDGSTDGTSAIVRSLAASEPRLKLVSHTANRGKTAALATGFARSRGEVVIVQDADLEYRPADMPRLIAPIIDGQADVVYGSRFLDRKSPMVYLRQHAANKFLTRASNAMTGLELSDVETGYKAFRGSIIRGIDIVSTGFGFEVEVTAKIARLGHAVREIPISYHGRTYAQGKKIGYKDFLAALWYVFYFNRLQRRGR